MCDEKVFVQNRICQNQNCKKDYQFFFNDHPKRTINEDTFWVSKCPSCENENAFSDGIFTIKDKVDIDDAVPAQIRKS